MQPGRPSNAADLLSGKNNNVVKKFHVSSMEQILKKIVQMFLIASLRMYHEQIRFYLLLIQL